MRLSFFLIALISFTNSYGQAFTDSVIDMHMHVYSKDRRWKMHVPNPVTGKPLTADNADKHYEATMQEMKKWNYRKSVISGDTTAQWLWKEHNPVLFITGLEIDGDNLPDTSWLRQAFKTGKVKVLGEIAVQYDGIAPDSSLLEPYYALAEEYDVPVAIHIGPGPPGAPYIGFPKYRMSLSNPLLLEEVLVRHPKLRIYVMHAGWPMADAMIALMYAHPQVYVDLGVIDWTRPLADFHDYLKRLVQSGFGKRIMFGSDQMIWPEAISIAIENILSANFLTKEQKSDIFYKNAQRFLKFK
ncbi:MAG: amidohydrolase family protein [Ferruginibacter sp.]